MGTSPCTHALPFYFIHSTSNCIFLVYVPATHHPTYIFNNLSICYFWLRVFQFLYPLYTICFASFFMVLSSSCPYLWFSFPKCLLCNFLFLHTEKYGTFFIFLREWPFPSFSSVMPSSHHTPPSIISCHLFLVVYILFLSHVPPTVVQNQHPFLWWFPCIAIAFI